MPFTIGTSGLLQYNARHKVLICQECKYGIQKSALESHLLRHKIYRGERRRLLSSIARLHLLEPEDVQIPPTSSPPVDGLSIISGYRCTTISCGILCASSKRMRRHWSEIHGVSDPSGSFARPVHLQTFFRGTKLRYFEVASPTITSESQQTSILHPTSPATLDLETLRYFHHFTTSTSLTLPSENHQSATHWQVDVVVKALQIHWLMYGLLSISASHLATLSDSETTRRMHIEQSAIFFQEFSAGWEEVKHGLGVVEVEEAEMGAQMMCIQLCSHWISHTSALSQMIIPEAVPFQIQPFMKAIIGCVDGQFALHSTVSNSIRGETFVWARHNSTETSIAEVHTDTPRDLIERLRTLPYRMAEVLDKPESAQDFFATVSALDALIECYSMSYPSEDKAVVWMGMESWLGKLSVHFKHLVWRRTAAALIVVAHWSLLVQRAEGDFWFLRGSATMIVHQISRDLPEDITVQKLIDNLAT